MSDTTDLPSEGQIDLTPCHFQNTFANPCFWLLLGIVAGGGIVWWLGCRKTA